MVILSNSKKPDKPIGSSGFSAGVKHICSYWAEDQNLTSGKELSLQYCSSSTTKSWGIMIGQFNIVKFN